MSIRIMLLPKNCFPINQTYSIVHKKLSTAFRYQYTICVIGTKGLFSWEKRVLSSEQWCRIYFRKGWGWVLWQGISLSDTSATCCLVIPRPFCVLIMEVFYWPIIYGLLSGKHTWNRGFPQESTARDTMLQEGSMFCRINDSRSVTELAGIRMAC